MKRRIKKYVSKGMVAVLLLITISLNTSKAAVQNNSNLTESIVSSEVTELNLYKASDSDKKARNAYKRYIKNYLSSKKQFPSSFSRICDINNDGISEMLFRYNNGIRYTCKIYTYKKGKIIKMKELNGCTNIYYNKNKKQICVDSPNGASHAILTCYKMVSTQLKQISKYECIWDYSGGTTKKKCYKNNKRISVKEFDKFSKRIFKWPNT